MGGELSERRNEDRIRVKEIEIYFAHGTRYCSGKLLNISEGGARIKTFTSMTQGDDIILILNTSKDLKIKATIRWQSKGGFYKIFGIQFHKLDRRSHIDLTILIQTLYHERLKHEK